MKINIKAWLKAEKKAFEYDWLYIDEVEAYALTHEEVTMETLVKLIERSTIKVRGFIEAGEADEFAYLVCKIGNLL